MRTIVKYTRFFIFTQDTTKSYLAEFTDGINIIYGANTSGKSSVIQSINYTFGINDEKYKLADLLTEKPIFRIDFSIFRGKETQICTIIRDDDFIYIKINDNPVVKFEGISGNNSTEHTKLKKYISELFGFRLRLNSKGNEVEAPIEAMFLPYYVAQDYGWIFPLKAFKNFDYYKGFKESYYDYYLGVVNPFEDKTEKYKLEEYKKELNSELEILERIKQSRQDLVFAQNNDESFVKKAIDYVGIYNNNRKSLIQNERKYIILVNKLRYNEERLSVLMDTQKQLINNSSFQKKCPICNQEICYSLTDKYVYFQNTEDTSSLIKTTKKEIVELKTQLNSLKKIIEKIRVELENNYAVLGSYNINKLSMNDWIKNKANIQILETIQDKEIDITVKRQEVITKLKTFQTDDNIKYERNKRSNEFCRYFIQYLNELNVKIVEGYKSPYKLSVFPQQGVELLKTMLAYHFAFNMVINKTDEIHKLPLCLDAIFKEDVDDSNKELILSFISKNASTDTQLICSVAESICEDNDNRHTVHSYNNVFFSNNAKLIKTGEVARSLLKSRCDSHMALLEGTISIMSE